MTTQTIRILTVDDHALLRQGIASLVAGQPDMRIVAEATTGREAVQEFHKHRPDVTLMDLQMPDMGGLEAIMAIRGEFPHARIIVLTTYSGDVQVVRALKAGACGYLLKGSLRKELLDAIRTVHRGHKTMSPEASFKVAEHTIADALTPTEVRILRLIADGLSNKEIGSSLGVSLDTVKGQVKSVLSKLGANDRAHAAIIGVRRGIIDL